MTHESRHTTRVKIHVGDHHRRAICNDGSQMSLETQEKLR